MPNLLQKDGLIIAETISGYNQNDFLLPLHQNLVQDHGQRLAGCTQVAE